MTGPNTVCTSCGHTEDAHKYSRHHTFFCNCRAFTQSPPTTDEQARDFRDDKGKFVKGHILTKGEKNANWQGGREKLNGYIAIYSPNHPYKNSRGYVYEHRLVMENFLGRNLSPEEVVHHKNGNRGDNRIENLELTNQSQHTAEHRGEDGRFNKRDGSQPKADIHALGSVTDAREPHELQDGRFNSSPSDHVQPSDGSDLLLPAANVHRPSEAAPVSIKDYNAFMHHGPYEAAKIQRQDGGSGNAPLNSGSSKTLYPKHPDAQISVRRVLEILHNVRCDECEEREYFLCSCGKIDVKEEIERAIQAEASR